MRYAAVTLLLLLAVCGPAAAAEPRALASLTDAVPIAAQGAWVAWSTRAESGWTLSAWHRGTTVRLPVPPRAEPFDLDAGTDARGRTVLTYSRCTRTPTIAFGRTSTWSGDGCRVHVLDLASGRERGIPIPRSRGSSDLMPSMWRGRVAFARHDPRHGNVAQVRLWDPATRRLRPLRHGAMPRGCPYRGGCRTEDRIGSVQALDLGPRLVAFLWLIQAPGVVGHAGYEVRADRLADGRSLLAGSGYLGEVCTEGDDAAVPFSPTVAGDRVWFAFMRSACYRNRYSMVRFDTGRRRARAGALPAEMLQVVRSGGELVALVAPPPRGDVPPSCSPSAPCRLERMDAPALPTPMRRARPPFF